MISFNSMEVRFEALKILVTGGSGFLAKILASNLRDRGHEVALASRKKSQQHPAIAGVRNITVRWDSPEDLFEACSGIEVIIHAAGLSAAESLDDPELSMVVNGENTGKLVTIAKASGARAFIYLSTVHVYSIQDNEFHSDELPNANSHPYAESNALGEKVSMSEATPSFKVFILRLANVFGTPRGGFGKASKLVVHDFAQQAVKHHKIKIKSSVGTTRYFVPSTYFTNLVDTLIRIKSEIPSRIIDVTWHRTFSLIEIATSLAKIVTQRTGSEPKIVELSKNQPPDYQREISSEFASLLCKQDQEVFESELENLVEYVIEGIGELE